MIAWTSHAEFHVKKDPSQDGWWLQNRAGAILAYCESEEEAERARVALHTACIEVASAVR